MRSLTGAKIQFLHKEEVGESGEGDGRERERWKDNLRDDTISEKIALCVDHIWILSQTDCVKNGQLKN